MRAPTETLVGLRSALLRGLYRAGWAGAVGAGLLAFAVAFGYTVSADQAGRRQDLAAERARLLKAAADPAQDQRSDRERLAAFYARFPTAAELPARLQELHRLADAHGVVLARADYRSSRDAGTALQRVSLSLPLSGPFEPVYAWLGEVLATMPEVAVEGLALKRESTEAGTVDIDLRLVLFLRGKA